MTTKDSGMLRLRDESIKKMGVQKATTYGAVLL